MAASSFETAAAMDTTTDINTNNATATAINIAGMSREELLAKFQSMEDFPIPTQVLSNDMIEPELIERYQKARDEYLKRQIETMFLDHIATYDGDSVVQIPEMPSEEEQAAVQEQVERAKAMVHKAAQGLYQQVLELQQKHSTFVLRREEFKKLIEQMEDNDNRQEGDDDVAMTDATTTLMDEDALDEEEEKLTLLQQKKARLQVQLQQLQEDNAKLEKETLQLEAENKQMLQGQDPPSPRSLETETAATEQELVRLKEMQDYYDGLRQMMEELTGIQILEVEHSAANGAASTCTATNDCNAKDTDEKNSAAAQDKDGVTMSFHIRLLKRHDIQITLTSPPPNAKHGDASLLRVEKATFLTSTQVKAISSDTDDADNENQRQLTIKPLDDLVKVSAMFPPGDDLRFVVRETMARIRVAEALVLELAELDNTVSITNIWGPSSSSSSSADVPKEVFAGVHQVVYCSMEKECLTVGLLLTAECPLMPGGVSIHELVGLGWEDAKVEMIRDTVSKEPYQKPVELVKAIQAEVKRLQDKDGLTIPATPVLPLRKKIDG